MLYDERERTSPRMRTVSPSVLERDNSQHSAAVQVNVKLTDRRGFAFTVRDMREP